MSALIESKKLRIAMQKSGRLSQDTQALLTSCGLKINLREQRLIAHVENMDIDLLRVRDDDIPGLVMDGVTRRALIAAGLAAPLPALSRDLAPRPLVFPRDHGTHNDTRTEWWYLTGSLQGRASASSPAQTYGFQITFFRSRVDVAAHSASRFATRQLIFAHAAITDLQRGELLHDQRIARAGWGLADAAEGDTHLTLRDWQLHRTGDVQRSTYRSRIPARAFQLDLNFTQTQPVLLQGQAGFSRKGPDPQQASHYYSHPHLAVAGSLRLHGQTLNVQGSAWLDHEWSESIMHPEAVGWDWIGMNLQDGRALTAFRLRRRDGSTLWSGGSLRTPGQPARIFTFPEVRFTPGQTPPDLGDLVDRHYQPLVMRLKNLRVPTIAAVNGIAAGAGASLALACTLLGGAQVLVSVFASPVLGALTIIRGAVTRGDTLIKVPSNDPFTTGAIARTATNVNAGGKTPVAGVLHAVFILLVMLVAAPLAGYLALPALAGLLLITAWNMSEPHKWRGYWAEPVEDRVLLVLTLPWIMTKNLWVSTGAHIINDWTLFGVGLLGTGTALLGQSGTLL